MTQYAKLIDGQLQICAPRHISNPRPDVLESYALAHGFKPIIEETQPHRLSTPYYRETEKQIRRGWLELELKTAREQLIAEIYAEKNRLLASTLIIEVDGKQYDFNTEAILNLQGVLQAGLAEIEWTLSDYTIVTLGQADLVTLMQAFLLKKQEIYAWQATLVAQSKAADTVAELASIAITFNTSGRAL